MIFLNKAIVFVVTAYFCAISWGIFVDLNHSAYHFFSNLESHSLPFKERAKDDWLLSIAQEIAETVREFKLTDYQFMPRNINDGIKMQITISTWPVRENRESKSIFFLNSEAIPSHCEVKKRGNEVALAYCI